MNTLRFGEFFSSKVPKYCILSHRWGEDEVTYEDVKQQKINVASKGYHKLYGACRLAKTLGYEWIWADMCCINKESSAELSEAINSMFLFYSQADLCIAYLTDVPLSCQNWKDTLNYFYQSKWFTRGWTLQELLAPKTLHFYDHGFNYIGSKTELSQAVSECTGIAHKYLDGTKRFNDASIATRMSWASKRETSRVEDRAYCLLGLFGVSMSPCYGEGDAAFYRLQCELLTRSDDESLFAWISPHVKDDEPLGLLAESPKDFMYSQDIERITTSSAGRQPIALTGRGLSFCHGLSKAYTYSYTTGTGEGKTKQTANTYIEGEAVVTIACDRKDSIGKKKKIAIFLREMRDGWYRVNGNQFYYTRSPLYKHHFQTFYVPQPSLTTTPRFQENGREISEFYRRKMEREREAELAEQRRKEEQDRRTLELLKSGLIMAGAGFSLYKIGDAWDKYKREEERKKELKSRFRDRSRSEDRRIGRY